jgi:hypothetical protein
VAYALALLVFFAAVLVSAPLAVAIGCIERQQRRARRKGR